MKNWGYHLILDCGNCAQQAIRNKTTIENFSRALVNRIDMVAYGNPQVQHFGSGNKAGYTLVQLIETSNICAHFVEETNDMYLDVFSCKPFQVQDVEDVVQDFFDPKSVRRTFVYRQAPRTLIENGNDSKNQVLK
jgi:S-adenosylmethionine decarboxylase